MANWSALLSKYGPKVAEELMPHADDASRVGEEMGRLLNAGVPYEEALNQVIMTKPKAPPVSSYVSKETNLGPRGPKSFELIPDKTGVMLENPGLPATRDPRYIQTLGPENLNYVDEIRDVTPGIAPEYQTKMLNPKQTPNVTEIPKVNEFPSESAMDMSELYNKTESPIFTEKYPKMSWAANNKGKLALGGLAGAGLLGTLLSPNPEQKMSEMLPTSSGLSTPKEPTVGPAGTQISDPTQILKEAVRTTSASTTRPSSDMIPSSKISVNASDFDTIGTQDNLKEALQAQQNINMLSQAGKLAQQLGHTISKTQPGDVSFWDNMAKQSGMPVEQYKALLENEKNDPSSGISKFYKETLKGMGIEIKGNPSASALEKQIPGLERILMQKENIAARKEASTEREKDRSLQRELVKSNKEEKDQYEAKERAKKRLDKSGTEYMNAAQAAQYVSDMDDKGANGAQQISLLYNFVKGLDPRSTVREGEVSLARAGGGVLSGTISQVLGEITMNPQLITPKLVGQLKSEITLRADQAKERYEKQQQSEFKLLKSRGVKEEEFEQVDPYYEMMKAPPKQVKSDIKFPIILRKDGHTATISNEKDLEEAKSEGWQ